MRRYPTNSPKAAARVLVMNIIADGRLHHVEMDFLNLLHIPEKLGLSQDSFAQVVKDYCFDLLADPRRTKIATASPELVDELLAEITEPALRQTIADFAFLISHADDQFCVIEQAVYQRMLQRWELDLSGVAVFTTESIKQLGAARKTARKHAQAVIERINHSATEHSSASIAQHHP